jgi:hypothetical protein
MIKGCIVDAVRGKVKVEKARLYMANNRMNDTTKSRSERQRAEYDRACPPRKPPIVVTSRFVVQKLVDLEFRFKGEKSSPVTGSLCRFWSS